MSLFPQGANQQLFLIRGDPAKDGVLFYRLGQICLGGKLGGIHPVLCIGDAGAMGHFRYGDGVIPGNDLDFYALGGKIGEGIRRFRTNLVGQHNQRQRVELPRFQDFLEFGGILGNQQHPVAPAGPFLYGLPKLVIPAAQGKFRRAHDKSALSPEHRSAPFGGGLERDPLGADPVGLPGEDLRHGFGGVVFRLNVRIDGRKNPLQPFGRIVCQRNHIFHLHAGCRNGAGLVHAQHIHPGQGFDAVHILYQHLLPGQLQGGYCHGHAGQQVQSLGNHADERRYRALHAVLQTQLQHFKLLIKQNQTNGN